MVKNEKAIYERSIEVRSYDVGPSARLSIPRLLSYLHDSAQDHAARYGFGYADLKPRGFAWALVSIQLSLKQLPLDKTFFATKTSVAKSAGPLVFRDYVAEQNNVPFAEGQSLWALIDLSTRRTGIVPSDLKQTLKQIAVPIQSSVQQVRRISALAEASHVLNKRVGHHDCDFNGHLNNVVTARWMLDALFEYAPNSHERATNIQLSYHHEALDGERLEVACLQLERVNTFYLEIKNHNQVLIANAMVS